MTTFLLVLTAITCLGGFAAYKHFHPKAKDDDSIEEALESVIEKSTGIDVDLTPDSKEQVKKKNKKKVI